MLTTHAAAAEHYDAHVNGQAKILALEHACLPALYAAGRRGVPIDLAAALELRDRIAANVQDLRARVFELAGHPFNLNSARQIEQTFRDRGADLAEAPRTPKADLRSSGRRAELDDSRIQDVGCMHAVGPGRSTAGSNGAVGVTFGGRAPMPLADGSAGLGNGRDRISVVGY